MKKLLMLVLSCFIGSTMLDSTIDGQAFNYQWLNPKESPLTEGWFGERIQNDPFVLSDELIQRSKWERRIDSINSSNETELQIGTVISVDFSSQNMSIIKLSDNRIIKKLTILAKEADGLSIKFDELNLQPESKMIIYNETEDFLVGPINGSEIQKIKKLTTDIVPGSVISIEIFELATNEESFFHISKIGYIIRKEPMINPFSNSEMSVKTTNCEVNVKCPLGDPLYHYRDGIVKCFIFLNPEITRYSGSLIGNTSNDFTPYVLTAFHNIDKNDDFNIDGIEEDYLEDLVLTFFNESASCASDYPPLNTISCSGATLRAAYQPSDMALLELETSNLDCRHLYSGWNRTNADPTDLYLLHHPSDDFGSIMKVSRDNNGTWKNQIPILVDHIWYPSEHYHTIDWNNGDSESGSSGGPLFDQSFHIVGQLLGGGSRCIGSTTIGYDYGGRLYKSWWMGSTPDERLKEWLDPTNTGLMSIPAKRNGGVIGPDILCSSDNYQFSLINPPNNVTITWTATPEYAFIQSSGTGSVANLNVSQYAYGSGSITFHVPHPSKGSLPFTKSFDFSNLTGLVNIEILDEYYNPVPEEYGSFALCPNSTYHLIANAPYGTPISNWNWNIPYGWQVLSPPNYSEILVSTPSYLYETYITVDVYNSDCQSWTYGAAVAPIIEYDNCYGYYRYVFSPNPVDEELFIEKLLSNENNSKNWILINSEISGLRIDEEISIVRIYNDDGMILEQEFDDKIMDINVSKLPNGIYYLHILNSNRIYKQKLVVWH